MTIGQLAERSGVSVETVRYYERRGLLSAPARTSSGYRRYEPDAVARLRFIRRAQSLGFTLHEIEDLLALRVRAPRSCDAIGRKTHEKLTLVRAKIRQLQQIERSLTRLAAACDERRPTSECPMLHELEGTETDDA